MPRRKKERKTRNSSEGGELQQRTSTHGESASLKQPLSKNSESKPNDVLPINRKFAQHYEESKRRQFLSNAPPGIFDNSDESSSSSEEEDEFGELLTKRIDRRVNETLEAIRSKDPRIYDKNKNFFKGINPDSENSDSASDAEDSSEDEPVAGWGTITNAAEQATPKLTLKDYVRESLLNNGRLSDDDEDRVSKEEQEPLDEDGDNVDHSTEEPNGTSDRLHSGGENSEKGQRKSIPKKMLGDFADVNSKDKFDEDESDDEFFTKRKKTATELEDEEKDFEVFMKNRSASISKQAGEDLLLHSYLEKETPDEKERFLRDFVLNNGWLDRNAEQAPAAKDYEIEIDTNDVDGEAQGPADEDEFDEKVDNFEAKYNFRFEDPEGAQIVSHARSIPDSMRRPNTKRKRAREARRLRKEQEKAEKAEEMKRLKNLKKKEIQVRLLAIQEAAGDGVDVTGLDLEGDFDPDSFNRQMESKFNDEYYSMKDKQMNDVTNEGLSHASEMKRSRQGRDDIPEDIRDEVKRMTDEYYDLDFEDIVGGVPMKFRYKNVEPESFNMTAEDILNADDKELNRLVSLKYLAPYHSKREVQKKAWKVRAALQKRRHVESFDRDEEQRIKKQESFAKNAPPVAGSGEVSTSGSSKRKRRKLKPDNNNNFLPDGEQGTAVGADIKLQVDENDQISLGCTSRKTDDNGTEVPDEKRSRKRKRRMRKLPSGRSYDNTQISEGRLKAYGISPP